MKRINQINNCEKCNNYSNDKIQLKKGLYKYILIIDRLESTIMQDIYQKLITDLAMGQGIDIASIYFTTITKCIGIQNLNIDNCIPYLKAEIVWIQPNVIVLLGEKVIERLLNITDNIDNIHGNIIEIKGMKYLLTYDLKDVIQNEDIKIKFWNDIKEAFSGQI